MAEDVPDKDACKYLFFGVYLKSGIERHICTGGDHAFHCPIDPYCKALEDSGKKYEHFNKFKKNK